jgi:hypothetical protein
MIQIPEGDLVFTFRDHSDAKKYDAWAFYRQQFQNGCAEHNKAVDMICYKGGQAWFIEVKDYRRPGSTTVKDLPCEIATKVRDTLAGLVAARLRANNEEEKAFAKKVLTAYDLRVVVHLEQPAKTGRLWKRVIEPGKLVQKLRSLIKAIDPHPKVVDHSSIPEFLPWSVSIAKSGEPVR